MHERELRAPPHPSQSTFYDPSTLKPWIHSEKIPWFPFTYFYFFSTIISPFCLSGSIFFRGRSAVGALIPITHQIHSWGSELLCILLDRKTTTKWGNASLKKRKHSFLFVIPCLAFWENCWEIDVAVNLRPSVTSLIEKMTWKKKAEFLFFIFLLIIWYLLRRGSKPEEIWQSGRFIMGVRWEYSWRGTENLYPNWTS